MKAIIETATGLALYLFPGAETVVITEAGMRADTMRALDIRPDTHSIATGVPAPTYWIGGGLIWNGSAWSYAGDGTVGLASRKAELKAAINTKRDALLVAGFAYDFGVPYGIKVMQTRPADISNWLGVASAAQNAVIASLPGTPIPIRVEDNTTIPLTAATVLPVLAALQAAQSAIHGVAWTKKDAVGAAADHSAIDAVDVDAGWP